MIQKWIPYSEVGERTEGAIVTGWSGMPESFDDDRLLLNAEALKSGVINWGGYGALLLSAYDGDADSYHMSADGVDESGVGVASGAMSVTRAETSDSHSAHDEELNALGVRNGALGVRWNISALNSRLDGVSQQFDAVTRAKQLDGAIRKESIKEVWRHNVTNVLHDNPLYMNGLHLLLDGYFVQNVTRDIVEGNIGGVGASVIGRCVGLTALRGLRSMRYGWKNMISDPLVWSTRPTRAIAATGVLASQQLVRAADS